MIATTSQPRVRWNPKFLDPTERQRVAASVPSLQQVRERRAKKPKMTLEELVKHANEYSAISQLYSYFSAYLVAARRAMNERGSDIRRRVEPAQQAVQRAERILPQLLERLNEADEMVRDRLNIQDPEDELWILNREINALENHLTCRRERKRWQNQRHAQNKQRRAEQNRLVATGSAFPKKKGKK